MLFGSKKKTPFLEWTPRLDIGDAEIDAEHRRMADLINAMHDGWHAGRPDAGLLRTFGLLVAEMESHFEGESQRMERSGYPGRAAHETEHRQLRDTLRRYHRQAATGDLPLGTPLFNALKAWLTNHTQLADRQLADFLRSRTAR